MYELNKTMCSNLQGKCVCANARAPKGNASSGLGIGVPLATWQFDPLPYAVCYDVIAARQWAAVGQ